MCFTSICDLAILLRAYTKVQKLGRSRLACFVLDGKIDTPSAMDSFKDHLEEKNKLDDEYASDGGCHDDDFWVFIFFSLSFSGVLEGRWERGFKHS